ncbi:hypothetical protein EDC94DRAFT_29801 [Helicostylum pulchrum]|nr:hypothetical protein EDC94DRAFT_29801 [Helicostylum pulchrum]
MKERERKKRVRSSIVVRITSSVACLLNVFQAQYFFNFPMLNTAFDYIIKPPSFFFNKKKRLLYYMVQIDLDLPCLNYTFCTCLSLLHMFTIAYVR